MPATGDDIRFNYTVAAGPGGANPQPSAADSYGGFASHTAAAGGVVNGVFPDPPDDPPTGYADYRAVFVYNASLSDRLTDVRVYLTEVPSGGSTVTVGVDPAGVVEYTSEDPQGVRPASGSTPPSGVTFSTPRSYAAGVPVGTLEPGSGRTVWLRRAASGTTTTAPQGSANLRAEGVP